MGRLVILRIPKAASSALVKATRYVAEHPKHHEHRLRDWPRSDLVLAVTRDPLDRFRSAYDMYVRDGTGNMRERFPRVDDFIAAGPDEWMHEMWGSAFWPQTYWLESADYVHSRDIIVMPIETFGDDMEAMGLERPVLSHHEPRPSVINEPGPLLEYYGPVIEMLAAL